MHCCAKPNLLQKRTVLVVGGGNGIGYCLTETLLNKTADHVISCDIDIDSSLSTLHHQFASNRFNIAYMDVTDTSSIQSCIDTIINTHQISFIDRVVICCGLFNGYPLLEISEKQFVNTIHVNVVGVWRVIKCLYSNHLLKYSRSVDKQHDRNDNSRVIIVSSEAACSHIVPFGEPYSLSKSCLQDLCRTLKIELSTVNMDVITINPGAVSTNLLNKMQKTFARANKNSTFATACELTIKCKDHAMKNSTCNDAQYIVDHALLYAIHCHTDIQNQNIILEGVASIIFYHTFQIKCMMPS
eukprot:1018433_1